MEKVQLGEEERKKCTVVWCRFVNRSHEVVISRRGTGLGETVQWRERFVICSDVVVLAKRENELVEKVQQEEEK